MKHGKRPTKKQAIFIKEHGFNPDNWFVVKHQPGLMVLVHRHFDKQVRIIQIFKEENY